MDISEYRKLFLSEAREILNAMNNVLVDLEKDPGNRELLNELFRGSHTLKSMAQSMGYDNIARLTHSMESALVLVRDGTLSVDHDMVDALMRSMDALSDFVEEVTDESGQEAAIQPLMERFRDIAGAGRGAAGTAPAPHAAAGQPGPVRIAAVEAQTVRIPLSRLDDLMDTVGELAIARTRLALLARGLGSKPLDEMLTHMARMTSRLQDQMLQVRLVPMEYIFAPYLRLVRDMAAPEKKEVDLEIQGSEIGLDRAIQDEINGPLLHLLKNAVTHGIEEPQDREERSKPRRGRVRLRARRERSNVVIELSDDGRGMDVKEIRETAVKKGIATEEQIGALTEKETLLLITSPGYSGAGRVNEAAGRGVGMNAVRTKVESFGGSLDIATKPGKGTTFVIKLPLTMAIIQALLVDVAGETFCIPLSHVAETIRISQDQIRAVERHAVISYRDTVLPLIGLKGKLGFQAPEPAPGQSGMAARLSSIPVVVVETESMRAGLIVDGLQGQQEIVIKPLTGMLKEVEGISGATILGTGKVALIVDVPRLI
ncbi:MAG: chemotaxis protein CheA [Pseudomonadota bacterium]